MVELAHERAFVVVARVEELNTRGILTVFAEIGDDVADAHDAALERGGAQVANV